jgi:hypothetical protein
MPGYGSADARMKAPPADFTARDGNAARLAARRDIVERRSPSMRCEIKDLAEINKYGKSAAAPSGAPRSKRPRRLTPPPPLAKPVHKRRRVRETFQGTDPVNLI